MRTSEKIERNIRHYTHVRKMRLYELAKLIGMTEAGLYKMFSTGSYKVKTLEIIAEALEVSLVSIMGYQNNGEDVMQKDDNLLAHSKKLIKILRASLDDKSRIIALLTKQLEEKRIVS